MALLAYTLPTLVLPPVGERLLLRYGPRWAIGAGLAVIGAGFLLMWLGSAGGWLLLCGCVTAGVGLGLTNTPVTNTTTGSVPGERAGMASGIDMSARMIALAVNIAVMGLVLTIGIASALRHAVPDIADWPDFERLVATIAGGATAGLPGVPANLPALALLAGFRWVMLYACASAWLLAAACFLPGRGEARQATKLKSR
jgi:MFS family permease